MIDHKNTVSQDLIVDFQGAQHDIQSIKLTDQHSVRFVQHILSQQQYSTLQSLDIYDYTKELNVNLIPHSITSLRCRSPVLIPDYVTLNHLEYSLSNCTLVFRSNDRSIVKEQIPLEYDINTSTFTPQPSRTIEEFILKAEINSKQKDIICFPKPNALIRKVDINYKMLLPDSVKVLVSNQLPINYPDSLETIILLGSFDYSTIQSIPSTVRNLHLSLDKRNISTFMKLNHDTNECFKDRYTNSLIDQSSTTPTIKTLTQESFFRIWRHKYLKNKINQCNQPKVIIFRQTIINKESFLYFLSPFEGRSTTKRQLKVKLEHISVLVQGVTQYSIKSCKKQSHLLMLLPKSVYKLCVHGSDVMKTDIPSTVRHLAIEIIHKDLIPSSIETLEFKTKYNCIKLELLQESIPSTVRSVILSTQCLLNERFITPQVLYFFKERGLFNNDKVVCQIYDGQEISLSTTVLIWRLDQMITVNVIPFGVKRIIFGHRFNQAISQGTIPTSVTEINFGNGFNQSLANLHLPFSLKYLSFNQIDQPIIPHTLPPSIITLSIKRYAPQYHESLIHLPKSIKYLKIGQVKLKQDYNNDTIKFKVCSIYSNPKEQDSSLVSTINNNLEQYEDETISDLQIDIATRTTTSTLNIHINFNINVAIPSGSLDHLNIKSIEFSRSFNQSLSIGSIPSCTKKLVYSRDSTFNQTINPLSISCIESLDLGYSFNQQISSPLPSSLTELHLSNSFNHPIKQGILPHGLKILSFGQCFNQIIQHGVVPITVEELTLYKLHPLQSDLGFIPDSVYKLTLVCFNNNEILATLPPSIRHIVIGCDNDVANNHNCGGLYFKQTIPKSITHFTLLNNKQQEIFHCCPSNKLINYKGLWRE
ncbi:hypothetical protein CYY_009919 [Polysphondylium violaceum]|uniref:FNIP repeat-containing protein n=1 Tax=Polysphondylium violaceum TaxID=133409 RepID=A0A8J4PJP0_9MYCE|nr:hypothetical protein CYY_009919 [Polysphondylium violaceum]